MNPLERVALLRAACCVAGIEQNISEPEHAVIQRLADDVGVGKASLTAMLERASTDPDFYQEQFRVLKGDPQESMAVLLEVAIADGSISDKEVTVLAELAKRLNVPEPVFSELVEQVKRLK